MNKAAAYSNNSVVFLAWQYDKPIANCLGFDVRRTDLKTKVMTHLPTWVPFQGETNEEWKPRGSWPGRDAKLDCDMIADVVWQ